MVLAVSRFRVANGLEAAVEDAFGRRPRLVESAPGFLGMETFTDSSQPSVFYLVTRWTDADSYETWHRSDAHERSHQFMPKGLKLDREWTKVVVLERLEGPDDAFEHLVADSLLGLSAFLRGSSRIFCMRVSAEGRIEATNRALADWLGLEAEAVVGEPIWPYLGSDGEAVLRRMVAKGASARGERFRLELRGPAKRSFTADCTVYAQPQGFTLFAEAVSPSSTCRTAS